jgi:hypothetical protein
LDGLEENPEGFVEGLAAVEIGEGALLLMQWSSIAFSDVVGLMVHDGAQAHFRFGTVRDTVTFELYDYLIGQNLETRQDAILHLANFISENAMVGLVVRHSLARGLGGAFRLNSLALQVLDAHPDFQYTCAIEGVRFVDNDHNIYATVLPLPDTGFDPEDPSSMESCPGVPWTCDWCTP